ncbi:AP-4 complex accessory subunit RUSC2 isoform X2 [Latimeria chalumnae]|uniref:AP-4 complex accessory subunit RUSC2 isoform X2 n=1 Tax=Latimeria chalumnae TaxID=7897 RepID=UPI0006D8EBC9|nr:PREDICTED: iporin [Latimeria chalumnae]|eukprot:XP_014350657.1 PREDICTED: iporin [Latimeria chalumnae]
MDSPPKLAGETLIVHHIPLVHCQVSDRQCRGGVGKRANPFSQTDLGITRTTSLPERDLSQKDSLVYSSLVQSFCPAVAAAAPEDTTEKQKEPKGPAGIKRHNPFILGESQDFDLKAAEGSSQASFHLHSNSYLSKPAFHLHDLASNSFHLHEVTNKVKQWSLASRPGVVEGQEASGASDNSAKTVGAQQPRLPVSEECMELALCNCRLDSVSTLSIECGDQEWSTSPDESMKNQDDGIINNTSRTCSCSSLELHQGRCCSLSDQSEVVDHQMGYISDSSCNSSDGVLVNFSALYNKMNDGQTKSNLNLANSSCDSSFCSHSEATGAFYLDLHSSPINEPKSPSCISHHLESPGKICGCGQGSSPTLDANCNSYHCPSESSDLTACFQSQARLVVATQNYYKLVTCDLSSQSSPSPAGSSITSCSEEQTKSSPGQPTEYYLFRRPEGKQESGNKAESTTRKDPQAATTGNVIEGQVYVNVSPPNATTGRQRSRSYDRSLDKSPPPRLGSLERMLSCPVKLSEGQSGDSGRSPPKRVTSFAELARCRRKSGFSPPLRSSGDSSLEFSPIPELHRADPVFPEDAGNRCHSLPPMPFAHCLGQGSEKPEQGSRSCQRDQDCSSGKGSSQASSGDDQVTQSLIPIGTSSSYGNYGKDHIPWNARAKTEGGGSDDEAVFRYSKDRRPTTLPIRPFILQHSFSKQLPKVRPLQGYCYSSRSQPSQPNSCTSLSSTSTTSTGQTPSAAAKPAAKRNNPAGGRASAQESAKKPGPSAMRPSPLGSYSPIRSNTPFLQGTDTSSRTPTPDRASACQPPRSHSCPLSASLLPVRPSPARDVALPGTARLEPARGEAARQEKETPKPTGKREIRLVQKVQAPSFCLQHSSLPTLPSDGPTANSTSSHSEQQQRRNSAESAKPGLASSLASRSANGQSVKQLQVYYSDFFPDYFSLAEKPPAEFCLSPDANTESISVDLLQKKGLVKAINTAVDLIVAHFGTSRDPGVKAKLGNSSVSPNVGHLILKYLCPAIRDILGDGLKAYVLDMIIGQRRNVPWSVVEASTQLGPSTKLLHSLVCKISQYAELTNHSMRFNAFIFGLLNIRSLEFWFNHLYTHEDIVSVHYQPSGFLALAHSVCQPLFEELLLLLQPLSLLPFDLDLLFEHHLAEMGREQRHKKEQLRVKQDLLQSAHSTFQLMRARGGGGGSESEDSQTAGLGEQPASVSCERMKAVGASAGEGENRSGLGEDRMVTAAKEQRVADLRKDKQSGWWYQLMQSSQVYIEGTAEGPKFVKWEKRKKQGVMGARMESGRKEVRSVPPRPPREGVVEGAEDCPEPEKPRGVELSGQREERAQKEGAEGLTKGAREVQTQGKCRLSWMGSPPESVLSELKNGAEKESGTVQRWTGWQQERAGDEPADGGQGLRWGHLFGAGVRPGRRAPADTGLDKMPKNRLPSGWLNLDKSVLQRVAQTVGGGRRRQAQADQVRSPSDGHHADQAGQVRTPSDGHQEGESEGHPSPQTPCEVKALCHHIATEEGQLSFNKGDVLRIVSKVDPDWLLCSVGSERGLVPIMYVTHPEDKDY